MKRSILRLVCLTLAICMLIPFAGAVDRMNPLLGITDAQSHWASTQIGFILSRELIDLRSASTFAPDELATRSELVVAFYRLTDEPRVFTPHSFEDVDTRAGYSNAVSWCTYAGIVSGYNETTFGPNAPITREQMATVIYRYAKRASVDVSERADFSEFSDAESVSDWAEDAMQWCVATGIITGRAGLKAGQIDPQGNTTRAELSVILQRFITYAEF